MQVTVTIEGQERTLDISVDSFTLQESVAIEQALGPEAFARFQQNGAYTPTVTRALLWVKLRQHIGGLELDGFDIDLASARGVVDAKEDDPGPFDDKS